MGPERRRTPLLIGLGVGILALLIVLASTGPTGDSEISGNVRRLGKPCLELEQWGLFGWVTIGQTTSVTQLTTGDWQSPVEDPSCPDVAESLFLVRLPIDARPDTYRICGLADDRACLTVELVPFESTGLGP